MKTARQLMKLALGHEARAKRKMKLKAKKLLREALANAENAAYYGHTSVDFWYLEDSNGGNIYIFDDECKIVCEKLHKLGYSTKVEPVDKTDPFDSRKRIEISWEK